MQLCRIIYVFAYEREGYHSDETWSYGFANSYYEPYISVEENKLKYNYKWTSSQIFRDYVEVNKGQEFSYDSVYYNQKRDLSPPLYSMVIHTICSFFPETFSWWYAFSINIVAFIMTQIVLYFMGKALTKSRIAALVLCLFYGFTIGAVNCFIYIRMYGMLTLFTVLSTYLHIRIYNKQFRNSAKEYISIFLVTLAGSLTHYYFLTFSFFMAACFCIYLMLKRYWKEFIIYACFMLLAVAVAFGIYPFAMHHIQSGPTLYKCQSQYLKRLEFCLAIFFYDITGVKLSFPNYYELSLLLCYIIGTIAFGGPIYFLFRKESWFLKVIHTIKQFIIKSTNNVVIILKKTPLTILFILITIFSTLSIIARISNVFLMSYLTDRYLSFLMPLFCAVIIYIINTVVEISQIKLKYRHGLLTLLVVAILAINWSNADYNCLFKKNSTGPDIQEVIKGTNCIIVTNKPWTLQYYASRLLDINSFFVIFDKDGLKPIEELKRDNINIPLYIIIENGNFIDEDGVINKFKSTNFEGLKGVGLNYTVEEFVGYFKKFDWITDIKYISTEDSLVGKLDLFRIYTK